jgi:hypothetical protein
MSRAARLALLPALAAVPALLPGTAPGQATQSATRPVSEGQSAVLIVRSLVDRAGTPGAAETAKHVVELGGPNDAPQAMRTAAAWVTANREAVEGVGKSPLAATPWGAATARPAAAGKPAKLYLHVFEWHASGKVIAYGLPAEAVTRAYLLSEPSKALKVEATPPNAIVEVAAKNAKAPDPTGTVVVLELSGEPKPRSLVVPAAADGSVTMHARQAVVVGRNLRYEPEPNKDTLGYWTNPADWAYWEFAVDRPGTFAVELLQGCGKGSGGSEVEVTVGTQSLAMTVEDTGHFQNFKPRVIGKATLAAGPHRVEVKVRQKKGAAVMDLRQVTLKPAG